MLLILCLVNQLAAAQDKIKGDAILGFWKANEKVLTINVYKQEQSYKAKIVSFTDHHNTTPSEQRTDEKNPDAALRTRKMIGMDVLTGLRYDADAAEWTDGEIYDAGSGKTYSATLELSSDGILSVRAYKGISLLGKTLTFHR